MIKYIIEILKLQNSLILPGFGSLQVNLKTGKISFNALLKFNDGTLAKYIAQTEGIDQQAAQNQIAKFIREIEAEIGKGNSFDMFQFGKFVKNKKGDVEFVQEGTPIEPVAETKKPTPIKEVKKEEVADAVAEAGSKVEIPKVEVPKVEVPKVEIPKVEIPKVEIPKVEIPKVEVPKVEIPKVEIPKVEIPKVEVPKVEVPKVEVPKVEVPKVELPKLEEKQLKNSFLPSKEEKNISEETLKQVQSDAKKADEKIPEISKNIPLAEASKKDPAAQEKNKFVPPVSDESAAHIAVSKDAIKSADVKISETPKVMAASVKEDIEKPRDKKEEPKKESVKEKFKKDKPQKIKNEEVKEKKKRSRWPMWIIIIIILGGGATAGWFYQDEIKTFFFAGVGENDKDSTKVNSTHPEDSLMSENTIHEEEIVDDTTMTEEPIVEEIVEEPVKDEPVKEQPVVTHSSSSGSYHIIGNSFSSKSNAENYVEKMNGKGYSASVLGKFDNLYLVSIKSYSTNDEAKSGLSSVSADAASAWVFKY